MNAERDTLDDLLSGADNTGLRLSPRQRELIVLIARGASNKQIARSLKITEGTVKQHLSSLYKKLGVKSRTQAIVRATELFGLRAGHADPLPASETSTQEEFSRRTIAAIAFVVHEPKTPSAPEHTRTELGLRALHQHLRRLAEALDGQLFVGPAGEWLVAFGAPQGHLDDAARALHVGRSIASWLPSEPSLKIAIGAAAAPSLVGSHDEPVYRSPVYEEALQLARVAPVNTVWCSDQICRLGGLLFTHQAIGKASSGKSTKRSARALLPSAVNAAAYSARNTLPFMGEVLTRARTGRAEWIAVAGWPPSASLQLLDAISLHCEADGWLTCRLRLANDRDPAAFGTHLHRQLRLVSRLRERKEGNERYISSQTEIERAVVGIKALCMRAPTALVLYGPTGLESMLRALGESGLKELETLPLVIVVAEGPSESAPHVTARLLGNRPLDPQGAKRYRLPLAAGAPSRDLRRDLAGMISVLSPAARQAVRLFVVHDKSSMVTGAKVAAQNLARELVASGLFVRNGETLVCRDTATLAALQTFFKPDASA